MLPNLKRPVRRAGDLKYVILWVASIILTVYITNGMYKMDSGCDTMSPVSRDKQDDLVEIVEIQEIAAPPQLEVVVPQEIEIQAGGESSIRPDRNLPLIFVGGVPRSGTTLMRAMLDAHESVRCGEETHIIPRLIFSRHQWTGSKRERDRLASAGLTDEIIDSAVSSFILEIITKHGKPAERMCNKDPLLLRFAGYMKTLFPRGKFILMIRDGRAVIHSIITRKVTISGFDLTDFRDCMSRWNDMIEHMYAECTAVGPESCLPVYYEQLVLHPEANMKKILKFLNLPWDERVLHHEKFVAGGEIALSKMEKSTDQVVKPVNLEALTSWAGHIPDDVVAEMDQIAPMLRTLGYDPTANPPKYGEPDDVIKQNTHDVQVNKDKWLNIAKNYSIHAGKKPMLRFKDKDLEKLLA